MSSNQHYSHEFHFFFIKDIPHDSSHKDDGQTHQFTDFPHTAADSDDDEDDRSKVKKIFFLNILNSEILVIVIHKK